MLVVTGRNSKLELQSFTCGGCSAKFLTGMRVREVCSELGRFACRWSLESWEQDETVQARQPVFVRCVCGAGCARMFWHAPFLAVYNVPAARSPLIPL